MTNAQAGQDSVPDFESQFLAHLKLLLSESVAVPAPYPESSVGRGPNQYANPWFSIVSHLANSGKEPTAKEEWAILLLRHITVSASNCSCL